VKTVNVLLFCLVGLLFGMMFGSGVQELLAGRIAAWEFWAFVGVASGLMLIPASFLFAVLFKKAPRRHRLVLRRIAIGYNAAAAALLVWHTTTLTIAGTHPVAFAAAEKVWSFIIAAVAALNALTLLAQGVPGDEVGPDAPQAASRPDLSAKPK
jgi:hypothetical protein